MSKPPLTIVNSANNSTAVHTTVRIVSNLKGQVDVNATVL
jgi:hypothetical protein